MLRARHVPIAPARRRQTTNQALLPQRANQRPNQGAIYRDSELGYRVAFCKSIDASRMSAASGAARHCGAAPISSSSCPPRAAAGDAHEGPSARACQSDVTNLFKKAGARRANQT